MRRNLSSLMIAIFIVFVPAFATRDTIWYPIIFYDFRANGSNPNFNPNDSKAGVFTAMIQDTLSRDSKPVFKNDLCFNDRVNEWFRPSGAGSEAVYDVVKNRWSGLVGRFNKPGEWVAQKFDSTYPLASILIYDSLPLVRVDQNGTYKYENNQFFPIANKGFGNESYWTNFSFTLEMHSYFTYKGDEYFTFSGDDDVWVFVNGKIALDIGGIHAPESRTFKTKDLEQSHHLEKGKAYRLDFFFAERHVWGSKLEITTNLITPTIFRSAEYYDTNTRPDGLIDKIKISTATTVPLTMDLQDILFQSIKLAPGRNLQYTKNDFRLIPPDCIEIDVKQPRGTIPFTAIDKNDYITLDRDIEVNGQAILTKHQLSMTDRMGPVINSAIYAFGSSSSRKDTLEVHFSEKVAIPQSDEPFQFCYRGDFSRKYSMKLQITNGNMSISDVMRFLVISKEKAEPENGDSIWIREGNRVIDAVNIPQGLMTVGIPLIVKPKIIDKDTLDISIASIGPYTMNDPVPPSLGSIFSCVGTPAAVVIGRINGLGSGNDQWAGTMTVYDPLGNVVVDRMPCEYRAVKQANGKFCGYAGFFWNCRNLNYRVVGPGVYRGVVTLFCNGYIVKKADVFISLKARPGT